LLVGRVLWAWPASDFHSLWINTMLRCVLMALLCLGFSMPGAAQTARNFPANALRGGLVITQPPEAQLNGQPARLAPGARIRGTNNMVLMSASLAGQALWVHYTLDGTGLVQNVWVLTPEEAARKPWPSNPQEAGTWRFDPATQTWTKP
jgi:hypothetical protein